MRPRRLETALVGIHFESQHLERLDAEERLGAGHQEGGGRTGPAGNGDADGADPETAPCPVGQGDHELLRESRGAHLPGEGRGNVECMAPVSTMNSTSALRRAETRALTNTWAIALLVSRR